MELVLVSVHRKKLTLQAKSRLVRITKLFRHQEEGHKLKTKNKQKKIKEVALYIDFAF